MGNALRSHKMIELLEPKHYDESIVMKLREMNEPLGLNWAIRDNEHYILDYPWIINKLPNPDKNIKILDAGCGEGALQFWCQDKYDTYSVDRIDYAKELRKKTPDINFIYAELNRLPFEDNMFDCIVSCSALEHNIPCEVKGVMKELARVLKPGGRLIFTIVSRAEVLFNSGDWWAYNGDGVRMFFLIPELKLFSDLDTTTKFQEIYYTKFIPMFKTQPYPYNPLGIVMEKYV